MSDLISRLRKHQNMLTEIGIDNKDMQEAADALEQKDAKFQALCDEHESDVERMTAEIARLREALERIITETRNSGYGPSLTANKLAREALTSRIREPSDNTDEMLAKYKSGKINC